MKTLKDISQLSEILNQTLGIHKNNCETAVDFAIALQKSRTVNLSQMVNYSGKVSEIKPESIYKNYQRLIHKSQISQSDLYHGYVWVRGLQINIINGSDQLALWQSRY